MSKGPGRLFLRGEYRTESTGVHSLVVRAPDGYRVTNAFCMPIEDQPVGDVELLGFVPTVDSLPAVTTGSYYNAFFFRYLQTDASSRGIYYNVFIEPVDGSDFMAGDGV